jgi:hypothetical protein
MRAVLRRPGRREVRVFTTALASALVLVAGGCSSREPAHDAAAAAPESAAAAPAPQPSPADSTSAAAAADVVRAYYAAIDARDFARAYRLWARDGSASGKPFADFAAGFANTAHVAADVGTPGRIDAAAGSRYVEVPVDVRATTRDATAQRFTGRYVLRRSEVDGATDEQRHWRLESANLREQR